MKNKVREEIAQSFIDSLKENIIPWEKQWVGGERAFNPITGTKYKGVNAFWLAYIAQMQDYEDPRWCTFNQAKEKGWKIKAGSKGTRIEFFSPYDREEKKKITWGRVKELQNQLSPEEFKLRVTYPSSTYTVFNAKQIDGIPEYEIKKEEWSKDKVIAARDTLFKNMELTFHEGGDQAFYRPSNDSITLPEIEHFKSEYGYLATMLHESAHATGAEKRLNRNLRNTFGTEEYAREELRAEIASAFTAQEIGLSNAEMEHTDNHKAYVQNWISVLQNDSAELFRAIKDAELISDYLIEKGEFNKDIALENDVMKEKTAEEEKNNEDEQTADKDGLVEKIVKFEVSNKLAARLFESNVTIHNLDNNEFKDIQEVLESKETIEITENEYKQAVEFEPPIEPTVVIVNSENDKLKAGKMYMLNEIMEVLKESEKNITISLVHGDKKENIELDDKSNNLSQLIKIMDENKEIGDLINGGLTREKEFDKYLGKLQIIHEIEKEKVEYKDLLFQDDGRPAKDVITEFMKSAMAEKDNRISSNKKMEQER